MTFYPTTFTNRKHFAYVRTSLAAATIFNTNLYVFFFSSCAASSSSSEWYICAVCAYFGVYACHYVYSCVSFFSCARVTVCLSIEDYAHFSMSLLSTYILFQYSLSLARLSLFFFHRMHQPH